MTIATDATDYLYFNFWFGAGSNYATLNSLVGQQTGVFSLFGFQLEEGTVVTPLEVPHVTTRMQAVARYFETSYPLRMTIGTITNDRPLALYIESGSAVWSKTTVPFRSEKRVAPTVTIYSP